MAKVAATHLYLTTRSGEVHAFAPGDALPSWAQRVITNPAAITDDTGRSTAPADDEPPQGEPSEAWKLDDLKAYAAERGIDVSGVRAKAGVLEAIAAAAAAADAPAQGDRTAEDTPPAAPADGSDAEDGSDEGDELSPVFDPSA